MEVQLFYLILITITTTIINFACGELFLQMPLTINPVVQEVITERGAIVQLFSSLDPEFYSSLSPVDMVTRLDYPLSHVMRKTISGAVVLGVAAKSDGLTNEQLLYNPYNKWTVNVSLTDLWTILATDEAHLFPFTDNITLAELQSLGLRALQHKYNISLENHAEILQSSNATTFQTIEKNWIEVVKYITASKINALATEHGVNVQTLGNALNMTWNDLCNITLDELDTILLKKLNFVWTSPVASTTSDTTTRNPTTAMFSNTPAIQNQSSTPSEKLATSLPTTIESKTTGKLFSTKPNLNLVSSAAGKPTERKSEGTATINLALFVGVAVGLLLLLVASSSVWCFRRKRRHSSPNEKTKNSKDIKMNNLWLDKTGNVTPLSPEEVGQTAELHKFVRSSSTSTLGVDSRFKELRYNTPRPSSSTFTEYSATTKVPISRNSFIYDHRREIFV